MEVEDIQEYINKYMPVIEDMIIDGDLSDEEILGIAISIVDTIPESVKLKLIEYLEEDEGELKPCPCCGGEAQFSSCVDYIKIFCSSCFMQTQAEYGFNDEERKAKVIKIWNKRRI